MNGAIGDDRHARGIWSALTEPGDAVAGALVEALGPADALAWLDEPSDGLEDAAFAAARARWTPRRRDADRVFESAARCGAALLTPDDDAWPVAVGDLGPSAPLALWVRGDASVLGPRPATTHGAAGAADWHVAELELAL